MITGIIECQRCGAKDELDRSMVLDGIIPTNWYATFIPLIGHVEFCPSCKEDLINWVKAGK